MDWVVEAEAALGDVGRMQDLVAAYSEMRAVEDMPRPVPKEHRALARAWDAKDWDVLEAGGWLTDDRQHLTPEATRILMGVWDQDDRASQ